MTKARVHVLSASITCRDGRGGRRPLRCRARSSLEVFLSREGQPSVPTLYGLFRERLAERETFDMYGVNFEGIPIPSVCSCPKTGPAGRSERITCNLISTKCRTPTDQSHSSVSTSSLQLVFNASPVSRLLKSALFCACDRSA